MRFDASAWIAPLVAALVLIVIVDQTSGALKSSGAWMRRGHRSAVRNDPYSRLDRLLVRADTGRVSGALRDPFAYSVAPAPTQIVHRVERPVEPPTTPVASPVLTSIVWDADPRATIRWNGRDYSVRVNSLFSDYQVAKITRDEVVLVQGAESLVLKLPVKGE